MRLHYALSLFFFSLALDPALPQNPIEHSVLSVFAGLEGGHQKKVVLSALRDQDPGALIAISMPAQQAKVRSQVAIDGALLGQQCAQWGIVVLGIDHPSIDPVRRSVQQA